MTTAVVMELDGTDPTITQEFTIEKRLELEGIRPLLFVVGDPAGTFTFTVKDGTATLSSSSLDVATMITNAGWTPGEHHFGVIDFALDDAVILNKDKTYTIELSSSGYTHAAASYIGWVKEHEYHKNNFTSTGEVLDNPYSLEMWGVYHDA